MLQGPSIELYKAMLEEHPDLYLYSFRKGNNSQALSSFQPFTAIFRSFTSAPRIIFPLNYNVLNRITSQTSLIVDFGGGVKSDEDLKIAFDFVLPAIHSYLPVFHVRTKNYLPTAVNFQPMAE